MKLVFAGTPEAAIPSLRTLIESPHEVIAVVTRPDAPTGRGRAMKPSPVREVARAHGIEVLTPTRPGDPAFLDRLRQLRPDCCPVVAYGGLLPQRALEVPRLGWVNLHFSILPAWRGAAPVQHAIWHGDTETGASVFQIVKELDAGPVFGQLVEALDPRDTAGDVLERLAHSGAQLLLSVMDAVATGQAHAIPQAGEGVSFAPKITVEHARTIWTHPAFAIDRQLRACAPAPGAWTTFRGERIKLGPALPTSDDTKLSPGQLAVGRKEVLIGTGAANLILGQVQALGKKPMPAVDWARGARPEPGEIFQ